MTKGAHGPHLRKEREAAGIEQQALAAEMGVDRVTVWRYESAYYVKAEQTGRYREALEALRSRVD
jgi:transcriptional regulator with XRE-family HTH domain